MSSITENGIKNEFLAEEDVDLDALKKRLVEFEKNISVKKYKRKDLGF